MSVRRLLTTMDDRGLHEVGDPNDTSELHAVIVTALMVLLFVFLVVMLYVAHYIVTKWWYVESPITPHIERPIPGVDTRDTSPTPPLLPFTSKIRKVYLETRLKCEVFHTDVDVPDADIEKGRDANRIVESNINRIRFKSLDTCSSAVTDSDSNNQSSSDDEEEVHNTANDDDEHDVFNERPEEEMDIDNELWPEVDVNTATQCLICFESYVDGDQLVRHCSRKKSFHRSCIIEWLLRNDNCPYCRSPFLNLSTPSDLSEQ